MKFSPWSQPLPERWKSLLEEPPGLITVDFDNTFVRGDYGEQIMEWLLARHYPSYAAMDEKDREMSLGWTYGKLFRDPVLAEDLHRKSSPSWRDFVFEEYNHVRETRGLGESYRWSSFIFSGWKEDEFRNLSRTIWLENLESYKKNPSHYESYPLPYPMKVHPRRPLLDLLQIFQDKGWTVNIVTASPVLAVEETTPELSLEKSQVIGMRQSLSIDGLLQSTIIEPYPYGDGKVDAILHKFGKKPDIAFGDTINDFPMLLVATKQAVLFQRNYSDLNEMAVKKGIFIENWI